MNKELIGRNILDCIGNTPLLRLERLGPNFPNAEFYGKAEWFNPGGSVKDRPALEMIRDAERTGKLKPGQTILDATSGNTGIAYAMIATIDPELANNGGVSRVIEARFRLGSIVDPNFPAPTNSYIPSTLALTEACLEALTAFVPERRIARVGGFGAMSLGGTRTDGSRFVQYELAGSAYGGRVGSDGPSGIAVLLSNARSASIEILESEFPTRIRRFEAALPRAARSKYSHPKRSCRCAVTVTGSRPPGATAAPTESRQAAPFIPARLKRNRSPRVFPACACGPATASSSTAAAAEVSALHSFAHWRAWLTMFATAMSLARVPCVITASAPIGSRRPSHCKRLRKREPGSDRRRYGRNVHGFCRARRVHGRDRSLQGDVNARP